jgi:hypothetical protein
MDENAADLFHLGPLERAHRYRNLAEALRCLAVGAANEDTRRGYLRMAMDCLDMADNLDAEFGNVSVTVDASEMAALLEGSSS